ncbi:hypothetical protein P4S68_07705 [Pseudoalteromonas sp. Hal099]
MQLRLKHPRVQSVAEYFKYIRAHQQPVKTVIKPATSLWRNWSFIATAACIILAFLVIQPTTQLQYSQQIALVQNQDKQSLWFINVDELNIIG